MGNLAITVLTNTEVWTVPVCIQASTGLRPPPRCLSLSIGQKTRHREPLHTQHTIDVTQALQSIHKAGFTSIAWQPESICFNGEGYLLVAVTEMSWLVA